MAVHHPKRLPLCLVAAAVASAVLLAPAAGGATQPTKRVAKEATSDSLGRTYLATLKGRALYSLSVERNGRFTCTGGCLQTWHPLLIRKGVKPRGPVKLRTIERPNDRTQVTYKGRPLYTFSGDSKAGDINGEGFKDVGTWHVATTGKANPPSPEPQPQPEPPPYPYPYPY